MSDAEEVVSLLEYGKAHDLDMLLLVFDREGQQVGMVTVCEDQALLGGVLEVTLARVRSGAHLRERRVVK